MPAASAIDTLKAVLDQISPQDNWEARAVAGIHDELDALQMNIAMHVLKQNRPPDNPVINTPPRTSRAIALARDAAMRPSLAAMTVAVRLLRQALRASPPLPAFAILRREISAMPSLAGGDTIHIGSFIVLMIFPAIH